jgi:hypothetical protein
MAMTSSNGSMPTANSINDAQASVIQRIFRDYVAGKSAKRITTELNKEGIEAPTGGTWGFSTINGNPKRGTGILNNELYVGKLVWNRQRFIKDPDTGKRQARRNPESEWIVQEVPEMRVIDDALWQATKERQKSCQIVRSDSTTKQLWERRRQKYLLSGMLQCGCCGGAYTMISAAMMGCAAARNKGTCDNRLNIRRDRLEERVLHALRHHLMDPALFAEFCDEFTREMNRMRGDAGAAITAARAETAKIDRDLDMLVNLILRGGAADKINAKMVGLEARKKELERDLAQAQEPPPLLHPNMAHHYRAQLDNLYQALEHDDEIKRFEAAEVIRSLIEAIILVPEGGELKIDVRGYLAGILAIAVERKKTRLKGGFFEGCDPWWGIAISLVAGAGLQIIAQVIKKYKTINIRKHRGSTHYTTTNLNLLRQYGLLLLKSQIHSRNFVYDGNLTQHHGFTPSMFSNNECSAAKDAALRDGRSDIPTRISVLKSSVGLAGARQTDRPFLLTHDRPGQGHQLRDLSTDSQSRPLESACRARRLLGVVVERHAPNGPVVIGINDTIARRWGRRINAQGIYRDPVRSSHGQFVKGQRAALAGFHGAHSGVMDQPDEDPAGLDAAAAQDIKIAFTISRMLHLCGRPRTGEPGRYGAMIAHSSYVKSVSYRRCLRLYCRRVHMVASDQLSQLSEITAIMVTQPFLGWTLRAPEPEFGSPIIDFPFQADLFQSPPAIP